MDNPEKIATLCTQDTGRRKTKQKTQHRTTANNKTSVKTPKGSSEFT
jgi:hypothetical protein